MHLTCLDVQGARDYGLGPMAQHLSADPILQFRKAGIYPRDIFLSHFEDSERHSFEKQHLAATAAERPSSSQPSSSAAHAAEPVLAPPPPPDAAPEYFRIKKFPAPAPAVALPATSEAAPAGSTYTEQLRFHGIEIPDFKHDKPVKSAIESKGLEPVRARAARERRIAKNLRPWNGDLRDCDEWLAKSDCNFGLHCCNLHIKGKGGTRPDLLERFRNEDGKGGGKGKGQGGGRAGGKGGRGWSDEGGGKGNGKGGGGKGNGKGGGRAGGQGGRGGQGP